MIILLATHQVATLLDDELRLMARDHALHLSDVLVLSWLHQNDEQACANLAWRLGRPRQSVQRSLESLEDRGLVERLDSVFTHRTVAWRLTEEGRRRWEALNQELCTDTLRSRTPSLDLGRLAVDLHALLRTLRLGVRNGKCRVLVDPPERTVVPDWDP
jgi:DNA-binding MarR family transcriptional regulator